VATPVSLPIFEQGGVNQRSPAQAKIALFRSLFHGREDVYPQRFESRKTGRAGYSPACGNEWSGEFARNRESSAPNVRTNVFFA
jgi:hypothetical protein